MRESLAERKVSGGKFVRVKVYLTDECVFTDLVVEGDFFAYPSDVIDELSKGVKGKTLDNALKAVAGALKGVSLGGIDVDVLLDLVEKAFQKACNDGK